MANILNIGVSALLANQRVLNTTSHNISNVNTEGFSRQRVGLTERLPQRIGVGFAGKGVNVASVERIADQFLIGQLRTSSSNQVKAEAFVDLADQVDLLLGAGAFSSSIESFFGALQDANDQPASISARQVLLASARALGAALKDEEARLSVINEGVNDKITRTVNDINTRTEALGEINHDIAEALGRSQGAPPNDLLDQREQLLLELGDLVGVTTVEQEDGALNIFMDGGQLLVAGPNSIDLAVAPNSLDQSRIEVAIDAGGVLLPISHIVTSGELGGIMEFRNEILNPARNEIGRIAAVLAISANEQHRNGMDLNGALGTDLFSISSPLINAAPTNTGTVGVALNPADLGGLTTSDYRLQHDGADFTLVRLSDGAQQTLAGPGPFNVDGMTIAVTSAPAAGDDYLIQPTKLIARNVDVNIRDPKQIALARPIRTTEALANIGSAAISAGEILDVTDPNLLVTTQLVFNDPPTTFQINGAGPLIPYVSGANIDVNGWRVQVEGATEPGDIFTIEANFGGNGDNANGLAVADLQFTNILEAGTATYEDAIGELVGTVGARTRQAQISRDALATLRTNAQAARDAVSAVNLDEEAANLLRFQQAYQAATQVIQVANHIFDALFDAIR